MPFYEYECTACKFYVEVLQKITDAPLTQCPSCGKQTMSRLISAPVFRLKGSGWYETDFKSGDEQKRNLADDKEPAKTDSDDKKPKVRASKALKKAPAKKSSAKSVKKVAKKSAKKPTQKVAKPAAKKTPKKAQKKSAAKSAKRPVKKYVKKAAKKTSRKVAKKK